MRTISFASLAFLVLLTSKLFGQIQLGTVPENLCLNQNEFLLYKSVNEYRNKLALDAIPLSKSLSYVAKLHARDLSENYPFGEDCNMYSWSDKGEWEPFCYPADQNRNNDIKDKAKEISSYSGKAYEITYWDNTDDTYDKIISFWNSIPYTSAIISNTDKFADIEWKSIGVGIQDGYVLLWFGKAADEETNLVLCETGEQLIGSVDKVEAEKTEETNSNSIQKHYIIIGSYKTRADAETTVKSYMDMGYPNAEVLEHNGKIRVSIDSFNNKEDADASLKQYQEKFKGSWIFSRTK
jgi:hypothetical protein